MKIALDASSLAGPINSYARTVAGLARGLAAAGHHPLLVAEDPDSLARERVPGTGVQPSASLAGASCFWSPTMKAPGGLEVPRIITIHDVNPLLRDPRHALERMLRGWRFRLRAGRSVRSATLVATNTEYSRTMVEQHVAGALGRVRVVGQSLDPSVRAPSPGDLTVLHEAMGVPEGSVVCLCALRRHKNPEGLVAAYARLPAALRREHPLVFAGPEERGRSRVLAAVRESGLVTGEVAILGRRSDAEICALYAGAAVFAYPSLLEGFGLPPLEAMACGAPVVSSDRASLPEVLGDAALLVDPEDAEDFGAGIERVLTDPVLADDLRKRGAAQAALYSDDALGAAASAVVEEVVASNS